MPDIRFICLSDLHFGAENSLLTHIEFTDDSVVADPSRASSTLRAFVECLRALVAANEDQSVKPTLILAGDIIEFALANDNVAAMAFERFVELAFPLGPEEQIFDPTIVYAPGNHDHHMWETARENQYANYVRRRPTTEPLAPPWHTTEMFAPDKPERTVESDLLIAVLERMGRTDLRVVIHYPNFALREPANGRVVVFHHGHFVEPMYRLMSLLRVALFPRQQPRRQAPWDWEAENFAWIDFFWSTLGRSGAVGADVGLIYDMLRSDSARALMASNLAGFFIRRVRPRFLQPVLRWIVSKIVELALRRIKRLEREKTGASEGQLTNDARGGLREYVEGPLTVQLETEHGTLPADFAFVFGHTHKPFEEVASWGYAGGKAEVYNTGGWVVDTLAASPRQGAAAVVLDERLKLASVRFYNQREKASDYRVDVQAARESDFSARLRSVIEPTQAPWSTLSSVVADAVPRRSRALAFIIQGGIKQLQEK